jgi:diguanylate cyclase (GGDEF)-like protein/PAS domain S-box-containing protein
VEEAAERGPRLELADAEAILDAITDRAIIKLGPTGEVNYWSAGAQKLFGYAGAEVIGHTVSMLHSTNQRAAGLAETELVDARQDGHVEFEGWRVRKDGNHFRAGVLIKTIQNQSGAITGFIKVVRDLAADQRRVQPVFFDLLEAAPDAMVIIGPDGRITMGNAQTDRMFGYSREELVGSHLEMLLPDRFRESHVQHRADYVADPMLRPMGHDLELFGRRCDGTEFPVDISLGPLHIENTLYVSASIRDVTERRNQEDRFRRQHEELIEAKQELERLARLDTLTGLVNHAETINRLESALQNRRNPGQHLGVLFCDTDHFKRINDTMGHNIGDLVLSTIATRIRDCVREGDTVGRIGGDEMLVLLPGVHSVEEVAAIGNKIRARVSEPIPTEGAPVYVTLSVGATLAFAGESVATMTTRADAAMYMAKKAGRDNVKTV